MSYNGWSNYETWNVALWMDNDYGLYLQRVEMAQECYDHADGDMDEAASKLAEQIESLVDDMNPLASQASMFTDMLNCALAEVDYREIASSWLEDVDKTEEETEETEEVAE